MNFNFLDVVAMQAVDRKTTGAAAFYVLFNSWMQNHDVFPSQVMHLTQSTQVVETACKNLFHAI